MIKVFQQPNDSDMKLFTLLILPINMYTSMYHIYLYMYVCVELRLCLCLCLPACGRVKSELAKKSSNKNCLCADNVRV